MPRVHSPYPTPDTLDLRADPGADVTRPIRNEDDAMSMAAGHNRPLCFVAMPRGTQPDASGGMVDFDAVYAQLIGPAIDRAGMQPLRSEAALDSIGTGYERIILCEHAIADLTAPDAQVFYELGVRHGLRPRTTVLTHAAGHRPPLDVATLRSVSYQLDDGVPSSAEADIALIAEALLATSSDAGADDFYALVEGVQTADISRLKTDVFRERVRYSEDVKHRLGEARSSSIEAVKAVDAELGDLAEVEAAVVIDLMLSYRAVGAWAEVIDVVDRMPTTLARSTMAREQLALALNRIGHGDEAEQLMLDLLDERGPSGETCAILGRIYKDRWQEAIDDGADNAGKVLSLAIDAYLQGFEADWRDAYPGINTVTLMELAEPPDERRLTLLPVVRYAVERRIADAAPDYWDHATLIELAVLAGDEPAAMSSLTDALASVRETWEPETTIRNLRLIARARARRGTPVEWANDIETALEESRATHAGG